MTAVDPPPSVRRTHRDWATTLTDNDLQAATDDVVFNPTAADWATTKGRYQLLHITYNIGDLLAELAELYEDDGAI